MRLWLKYTVSAAFCLAVATATVSSVILYQTRVPAEAIRTAVVRDPEAIDRAWRLPVAATFRRELSWQSNASMCGPASAANVFRSLGEAKDSEQAVLAGTGLCRTRYCILGLTLDELADVIRKNTTRRVTVLRDLSPEQFLAHMRRANDPDRRYIVNFSREPVFGAGAGHHSPIGGYLEGNDLVFVLDMNRDFKPWLVQRSRLYAAMNTLDGDSRRGLILIE